MALRFFDGFDHYTSEADLYTKWTGFFNAGRPPGSAVGRFGGGWPIDNNNSRTVYKQLDNQPTWIVGAAVKRTLAGQSGHNNIFAFLDAGTYQCYVGVDEASALLKVYRFNGNLLGTGTIPITLGSWMYIEAKVTISDASGIFVVRVNGVVDINLSGVDTKNTANATASMIQLNGGTLAGTGQENKYDDVYIEDGVDATGSQGAPFNDFLGDVRAESLFPSGNGNSSQFVGQDADSVNNYLNVDETTPDGDTTYNESATVGEKDTYAYTNLTPTSGTVYAVQPVPYARKTDAGARSIKTVARHSGTEEDSADTPLGTSYTILRDLRTTKPGGGAWTIADVNAAEFGVKVST